MRQRIPPSMRGRKVKLAVKPCAACGEDFEYPAAYTRGYATCSAECTSANRRIPLVTQDCLECGTTFSLTAGQRCYGAKFCGNSCRITALQRVPRPTKGQGGGWLDSEGHVVLAVWNGDVRRVAKRARLVMEDVIGRELTRTEVVHHINLIPDDDRPENLWLCIDQAEHMRIHAFTERLKATNLISFPEAPRRGPAGRSEDGVICSEQEVV